MLIDANFRCCLVYYFQQQKQKIDMILLLFAMAADYVWTLKLGVSRHDIYSEASRELDQKFKFASVETE